MTLVSSAHANGDRNGSGLPKVPSIPLADDRAYAEAGDQSIGNLVKDATTHLSTLVRAEVELAKSEVVGEVKKGFKGTLYFVIGLVIALYSSFFFFFFLAEFIHHFFGWAYYIAYGSVFGLMIVCVVMTVFLGVRKYKSIRAPERTMSTMRDTAAVLSHPGSRNGHEAAAAIRKP